MELPEAYDEPPEAFNQVACRVDRQFLWKGGHRFRITLEAAMLEAKAPAPAEPAEEPAEAPAPAG